MKSIVLLTDIPGADPLIYKLFGASFDIFADTNKKDNQEALGKSVEHHISSLLITVVDESSNLPSDAVDIILAQFLRLDPSTFPLQVKKSARADEQRGIFHLQQIPPAYGMAKNICTSCPDKMARMVSQYFNSVLSHEDDFAEKPKRSSNKGKHTRDEDIDDDDGAPGVSDEHLKSIERTHRLLRELWRSSATVIQNIVPTLEAELTAEDIQVRVLATETVGDLISGIGAAGPPPPAILDPAAYPSQSSRLVQPQTKSYDFLTTPSAPHAFSTVHPTSFQNFMNRRNDKSPQVRAMWVTCAGRILSTSAGGVGLDPQEEEDLLNWMSESLVDMDERVRLAAVQAVGRCDFPTIVERIGSNGGVDDSKSILSNLADRIKDRKHNVRVEAMALLGRIWGVAAGAITEGDENVRSLLGAIPSKIFQAIYINDVEVNALVQQVLTDSLLPLSYPPLKKDKTSSNGDSQRVKDSQTAQSQSDKGPSPDAIRAERILVLVRDLGQKAKSVFFALQSRQAKTAQYLAAFVKQCEDYNGGVTGKSGNDSSDKLVKLIDLFARQRPDPLTATEHLWKFAKKHDRRCYQLIRFAINPECEYKKVYNACKELSKRIEEQPGSNAAILTTLMPIVHAASVFVYNKSHVPTIVELARAEGKELENAAHEVLKEISEHNPEVFKAHVKTLCQELERQTPSAENASDPGVVETLKACAGFAQRYPAEITPTREFLLSMVKYALLGTPSVAAKHAVSVVVAVDEKKDMYIKDIVTGCTKDFKYGADGFLSKLAALSQLMLLSAKDIEDEHDAILQISIQEILMQVRTEAKEDDPPWQEELDDECAAKVWALKIVTNRLRSYANSVSDAEMEGIVTEFAHPVFKLLNSIIRQDGEISKKDPTPTYHRAHLRLTAAILMLKLCAAHKRLDALLTPSDFNRLTIVAQDALPEVRAAFVTRVKKHLGQGRLPHRFYTLIFLLAYEPNANVKESTATWLRGRAAAFAKAGDTIMEATLARFLSLLAHHPDFSMDVENLKDFVEYIMFYLKTVATQANMPLIFYVAQRLKGVQDGIDETKSDNLYTVSDTAQAVIRAYADVQGWSLTTFPGKLRLPAGLFAQLPSHTIAQEISEKVYAPEELLEKIEELVRQSLRTKKRKLDSAANQAKKRVKASESKPTKSLPVRKAPKPKPAKTPRKKLAAAEGAASAGATPSTEIRRSTRKPRTTNYAESSEDEEDVNMNEQVSVTEQSGSEEASEAEDSSPAPKAQAKAKAKASAPATSGGRAKSAAKKSTRETTKARAQVAADDSGGELSDAPASDDELSEPPSDMEE